MKKNITTGEKYGPAMKITDPDEALKYFEECVIHTMGFGTTRQEAIKIEKSNFGYWAGYFNRETRIRVEELFGGVHPFFGTAKNKCLTPEEAFKMGQEFAMRNK